MVDIYTWHGKGFDLSVEKVDHSKSIYNDVKYLSEAYDAITKYIDNDQFLFGYLKKEDGHRYYEIGKEIHYHIRLPLKQTPLFIKSKPWEDAIHFGTDPVQAFFKNQTSYTDTVVFRCPVSTYHIISIEEYDIISPEEAKLLKMHSNKTNNPRHRTSRFASR